MKKTTSSVFLVFVVLCSCSIENKNQNDSKAIYHWISEFDPSEETISFLNSEGFNRIYLHVFDVIRTGDAPVPVAETSFKTALPSGFEIIPVVFIRNDVFKDMRERDIDSLSARIYRKIGRTIEMEAVKEVQIDCDWTLSSRDSYFKFLELFRQRIGDRQLSVTIRLYPFKYRDQMGVPPVDKGMLMYYNMGNIGSFSESNSILNNKEGKKYVQDPEYPLHLDVALPIFSWSVLFRNNEFEGLIRSVTAEEWDKVTFADKRAFNRYEIREDTVFRGVLYRYGDEVRVESVTSDALVLARENLEPIIQKHNSYIVVYHVTNITDINEDLIHSIFQ